MDPRGGDRVEEASVDIAAWLHGLGLQQYEQVFRESAIDDAVLPELTADDLKDLLCVPIMPSERSADGDRRAK